jgi:hypothetical protein
MISIAKAATTMRDLAEKLGLRYANSASINTVRQAADAQGWPMLFCSVAGNEAEAQAVIVLRMKGLAVPALDQFGQPQYAYAPHTMELAYEAGSVAGHGIPVESDLLKAMLEATKTGVTILQKEIANGTAVTEASMNAAVVASELQANLYWPNKGV